MPKIFTWGNKRPRRLCFAVGLYTIGYQIFDMTYASLMHNSRPPLNLTNRYGPGTWAVISGCGNDLGKEYALTLASKGFNIVLVDASGNSLSSVKSSVESKYSGAKVVQLYFDHDEKDEWQEYEQLCNNIKE